MMKSDEKNWLETCLGKLGAGRVAVFGDFCVDAYWIMGPDNGESSVETGLPVWRVKEQKYYLGAAGNVAANLASIGVGEIHAISMMGDDLYGRCMLKLLSDLGVKTGSVLACQDNWQTMVFGKPYINDAEQNRIDFGGYNEIAPASIDALVAELDRLASNVDMVILNQQVPAGVSSPAMIDRLNEVVAAHPECRFIVDSRHRAGLYKGAMLKVNAHEAVELLGIERQLDQRVTADEARVCAQRLYEKNGKPVFVTRGENGTVVVDENGLHDIPGIQIIERVDTVGAGDTTVSAMAAALASGSDCPTAAKLANIAASVTVRKLKTTGTANVDEIRQVGPTPYYVYLPELADDIRHARHIDGSEIEVIRQLPEKLKIRHAIFDHDGTISTLRQGWEKIMCPMMLHAILGPRYEDADEVLYHKALDQAEKYIDKTTGIQTLSQMQGLVELVKEFGCVSADQILDMHGYKAVYNDELLEMVNQRIAKLRRGELDTGDFLVKNARKLLERLADAGVKLYLASGTDEADVIAEAAAMGYADLFEGRIFGAIGDVKVEAKKVVLERIIGENNLSGTEFVTFGDGPVEMREARGRGGVTVGVASNELQRFGLDESKRARLIRAGADIVVPDFSQLDRLLEVLQVKRN